MCAPEAAGSHWQANAPQPYGINPPINPNLQILYPHIPQTRQIGSVGFCAILALDTLADTNAGINGDGILRAGINDHAQGKQYLVTVQGVQ